MALLGQLRMLVRVTAVTEANIQSALASPFSDFEDAIQHYSAQSEGGVSAIITRNTADYSASDIAVLSPEAFLTEWPPVGE